MFRVRLASGDEKTYRTIDDIVWDIETGVVTRDARLFHVASQSWVSVARNPRLASRLKVQPRPGEVPLEFDPMPDVILADAIIETDEVLRAREREAAAKDVTDTPSLGITSNADFLGAAGGASTVPPPVPEPATPPPAPVREPERPSPIPPPSAPPAEPPAPIIVPGPPPPPPPAPPSAALPVPPLDGGLAPLPEPPLDGDLAPLPGEELDEPPVEYKPLDWKPDRDYKGVLVRVAQLAGVLVVVAGVVAGWRALARDMATSAEAEADSLVPPQAVDTIPDSVLNAAVAMMEAAETTDAEVLLRRKLGQKGRGASRREIAGLRAMAPVELRRSYTVAYSQARASMDSALAIADVDDLFAAERLASTEGLRAGRRLVTAARNVFAGYRRAEVQIERAYRDTVAYQVRRMGWGAAQQNDWKSRATLKESFEGAQLSDSLLATVDGIYALLMANRGRYDVSAGGIRFDDPAAANDYARRARWLAARVDRVSQASDPGDQPTARRLVEALAASRPPNLLTD